MWESDSPLPLPAVGQEVIVLGTRYRVGSLTPTYTSESRNGADAFIAVEINEVGDSLGVY